MKKVITYLVVVFYVSFSAYAQPQLPFSKGVNISWWFQANDAEEIPFSNFSEKDIADLKSLGMDAIRLPIGLHYMTSGSPDYIIQPLLFQMLDSVIAWSTKHEMHLIIDNHSFDPAVSTDPNVGDVLRKVWLQMAHYYKNYGDNIYFEILNEPHGIKSKVWDTIQKSVIETIRTVDKKHMLIVGATSWNSADFLDSISLYEDPNIIYTFHFYDPYIFTHQGATWTSPSFENLTNIPFPYHEDKMPELPAEFKNTWIEDHLATTYKTSGSEDGVKKRLDVAINFSKKHNVPVYCGELGVLYDGSDKQERANWHRIVTSYLSENNVPWTMWEYKGGYGLFEKNTDKLFEHHLNSTLVEALGFNMPKQTAYENKKMTGSFTVYDEFLAAGIIDKSNMAKDIQNFYDTTAPSSGNYCLKFAKAKKYQITKWEYMPVRDLSVLAGENYALDFMFKANSACPSVDIRISDSDLGESDHAWRMRYTISKDIVKFDDQWHNIHIPLSSFKEQGAYEDKWYNAEGKFDWSEIKTFSIAAEHGDFGNTAMWFDNMYFTTLDSSKITVPIPNQDYENAIKQGFIIYDDALGVGISEVSYLASDKLDLQSINFPNNGNYCIKFSDVDQYTSIKMEFDEARNIKYLADEGYALNFMLRADSAASDLDIRFVDTDLGADDVGWRIGYKIKKEDIAYNGEWQNIHIPLSSFKEQGAYDVTWHNPEGKFDWMQIKSFQIIAEYGSMKGSAIYFDNIHITNKDTSQVFEHQDSSGQIVNVNNADKQGFVIYDDKLATNIGNISFLPEENFVLNNEISPNNGKYCATILNLEKGKAIKLEFSPVKNLSFLVQQDYALDMMIRADSNAADFDVRFIDTDLGENDHGWRMGYKISKENTIYNGEWQHVHIKFSEFKEQGAYDGGWYNPEGKFDWEQAYTLAFVLEYEALERASISFDNIHITNMDTAKVYAHIDPEPVTTSAEGVNVGRTIRKRGNKIEINVSTKTPVKITDMSGLVCFKEEFCAPAEIYIEMLPSRVYIITAGKEQLQFFNE